jgi:hypothetical protein
MPTVNKIDTANTKKGNLAVLSLLSNFCKDLDTISIFRRRKHAFSAIRLETFYFAGAIIMPLKRSSQKFPIG